MTKPAGPLMIVWFPAGVQLPRYRYASTKKQAVERRQAEVGYVIDQGNNRWSTGEWALIHENDPLNPEIETKWGKYSL